jgi:hypothetical protein
MINILNQFKPKTPKINKVLCIIEGQTELQYLLQVFRKYIEIRCDEFIDEFVVVRWGKLIPTIKGYCKFQGGAQKDIKMPFPALEAFEFEREYLENYFAIIVMFDGDKDKNREVEKIFLEKLKSIKVKNILLVSNPCFESSLIDYCKCGECRDKINSFEETKYPCDKYKNNFSKLNCFKGVNNLIENIKDYSTQNEKLLKIETILNNLSKIKN